MQHKITATEGQKHQVTSDKNYSTVIKNDKL